MWKSQSIKVKLEDRKVSAVPAKQAWKTAIFSLFVKSNFIPGAKKNIKIPYIFKFSKKLKIPPRMQNSKPFLQYNLIPVTHKIAKTDSLKLPTTTSLME